MTAKELQAKISADPALLEKFKAVKSVDELVELAKQYGFELDAAEIEKLSDVSAEDLSKAAGGGRVIAWTDWAIVTEW